MLQNMLSQKYILTICLLLSVMTVCSSKKAKYSKKPKTTTTTTTPCESTSGSYSTVVSTNAATDGWMPYSYSYTASVGSYGDNGMIAAAQSGNSDGVVTGSYSLESSNGQMRQVVYKADKSGFHATVKTNEQGTANEDPADVHIISSYDGSSGTQSTAGYESTTGETTDSTSTQDYYAETTEVTTKKMCVCKMTTTAASVTKAPTKNCRCYTKKPQTTTKKAMTTKPPYKRPKPKTTTKAPYKKKTTKAATTKKPTKKYTKTKVPNMTTKKPKYDQYSY